MRFMKIIAAFWMVVCASAAAAQGTKSDQVFQVTETIVLELQQLNGENFSSAQAAASYNEDTMPRHVYFLARDQWRKVQLLRFMNGLETHNLDVVSIRKITPRQVKGLVDQLLLQVRDLRPAYGLPESTVAAAEVSGKMPKDVYGSLLRISAELDALGVPATVPNDVFLVAQTVTQALKPIARKQGVDTDMVDYLPLEAGRTPADTYNAAHQLLKSLKQLSEAKPEFAVEGGIIVPKAQEGNISPTDVMLLLSRMLADVVAVMEAAKAAFVLEYAPYEGGKTPSDVFRAINQAQMLVFSMSKSSS